MQQLTRLFRCSNRIRLSHNFTILCVFSGLAGLVALSIFASGVFIEVFENLQAKLTTMNGRLDGAEYDAKYTPIVYIGWLSRFFPSLMFIFFLTQFYTTVPWAFSAALVYVVWLLQCTSNMTGQIISNLRHRDLYIYIRTK